MNEPNWKIITCKSPSAWALEKRAYELSACQHEASRKALAELFSEQGIHLQDFQLELQNYHKVMDQKDYVASFSHTGPHFGAAALGHLSYCQSVGIDIERTDREMRVDSGHHFLNSADDEGLHQDLLLAWCLKEASYKAYSPFWSEEIKGKPFVLKNLAVRGDRFYLGAETLPKGFIKREVVSHGGQNFFLTLAWTTDS